MNKDSISHLHDFAWLLGTLILLLLAAPFVAVTQIDKLATVAPFASLILAIVWGVVIGALRSA